MPFQSQKAKLQLSAEDREQLERFSKSRTEKHAKVVRARMLLAYTDGKSISAISRQLNESRSKVDRCLRKA